MRNRAFLFCLSLAALLALPASDAAASKRQTITVETVTVGSPGNADVGVVPFSDAIYKDCSSAPPPTKNENTCQELGGVDYNYRIGLLEVTVEQWVKFLNTVDPLGVDTTDLYDPTQAASRWPKYGAINRNRSARPGHRYSVAYPQWADKPYAFADFPRAAQFVNSLFNGRVLSKRATSKNGVSVETFKVRLSRTTTRGMYNIGHRRNSGAKRAHKAGFVIPSQDEWIKAAYFDPKGGGTYSYWKYPTNPGVFGDGSATAPNQVTLDPANGNVTNASTQPLANYHNTAIAAPNWCPSQISPQAQCDTKNPFGIGPEAYQKAYQGSVGTVGQAQTRSPWGTLDQGGNAVEWTDTITPPPSGGTSKRVWRRLHGGIANAPVYQLWLSAIGLQPETNTFFKTTYPWLGIRIGAVGNIKLGSQDPSGDNAGGGNDNAKPNPNRVDRVKNPKLLG